MTIRRNFISICIACLWACGGNGSSNHVSEQPDASHTVDPGATCGIAEAAQPVTVGVTCTTLTAYSNAIPASGTKYPSYVSDVLAPSDQRMFIGISSLSDAMMNYNPEVMMYDGSNWSTSMLPSTKSILTPSMTNHGHVTSLFETLNGELFAAAFAESEMGFLGYLSSSTATWQTLKPWEPAFTGVGNVSSVSGAANTVFVAVSEPQANYTCVDHVFRRSSNGAWSDISADIPSFSAIKGTNDGVASPACGASLFFEHVSNGLLWKNQINAQDGTTASYLWQFDGCSWSSLSIPDSLSGRIISAKAYGRSIALIVMRGLDASYHLIETDDRINWSEAMDTSNTTNAYMDLEYVDTGSVLLVGYGSGTSTRSSSIFSAVNGAISVQQTFPSSEQAVRIKRVGTSHQYVGLTTKGLYQTTCQ